MGAAGCASPALNGYQVWGASLTNLASAALILVAMVSYRFLETPFLRLKDRIS